MNPSITLPKFALVLRHAFRTDARLVMDAAERHTQMVVEATAEYCALIIEYEVEKARARDGRNQPVHIDANRLIQILEKLLMSSNEKIQPRVLVFVSGGVAETYEDDGVNVFVFDQDNFLDDPIGNPEIPEQLAHLDPRTDEQRAKSKRIREKLRVKEESYELPHPDGPRVLIFVSGGIAEVYADDGADYFVIDQDDFAHDPVNTDEIPAKFADLDPRSESEREQARRSREYAQQQGG